MKTYKLKGIEKYTVAFDISDAKIVFWINKIGVLETDIEEIDTQPNRDAIGKVFDSIDALQDYYIEL